VWAYVIQLGQERGGMYSYDLLENLVGCAMHTVDHVVPAWQTIQVGDLIRLGPKGKTYPIYKVAAYDPQHALVVMGADPKTEQVPELAEPMPAQYVTASWALCLEPIGTGATRLISRWRLDYNGGAAMTLLWRITEVLNLVMERKMLATVKRLAERDSGRQS